jgi:hypothetical protein
MASEVDCHAGCNDIQSSPLTPPIVIMPAFKARVIYCPNVTAPARVYANVSCFIISSVITERKGHSMPFSSGSSSWSTKIRNSGTNKVFEDTRTTALSDVPPGSRLIIAQRTDESVSIEDVLANFRSFRISPASGVRLATEGLSDARRGSTKALGDAGRELAVTACATLSVP